ncbi:MAG: hypothetical protein M0D55_19235 [Elusimicrobiota bacterium]|nr:MAG: hypothetical protein M0D55_19235 [Elusimicrobiota bacterium]
MIAALLLAAALPAAAAPAKTNWIKTYPMTAYRETWTGELSVKKLDEAMPKVVAAVEKNEGRLTQPLAAFVASADARQISFVLPLDKAKKTLAALRKLGKSPEPAVRALGEKIPLDEVRSKLQRLSREKTDNPVAFAQVPLTTEIVDELIEHLANVEAVARTAPSEVLWNLTVREAR